MKSRPDVPDALWATIRRQDGAMTVAQAACAGLTHNQLRTLRQQGWSRPTQGVLVVPDPADPFRASLRAALLACPNAAISGVSAARMHALWGLPQWTSAELPNLLLPAGATYHRRTGVELHSGLLAGEMTSLAGFPVTSLGRTVRDVSCVLALDDLVCLLDSALRQGWHPDDQPARCLRKLKEAMALADGRAESALETHVRLLLVRAGLAPETLQLEIFDKDGRLFARLDLAWSSRKLAVEADGRMYHEAPDALYRDRSRANALALAGWTILRFTWADVRHRPERVVSQVRAALVGVPRNGETVAYNAS